MEERGRRVDERGRRVEERNMKIERWYGKRKKLTFDGSTGIQI